MGELRIFIAEYVQTRSRFTATDVNLAAKDAGIESSIRTVKFEIRRLVSKGLVRPYTDCIWTDGRPGHYEPVPNEKEPA